VRQTPGVRSFTFSNSRKNSASSAMT
jgi:hypothetical protein